MRTDRFIIFFEVLFCVFTLLTSVSADDQKDFIYEDNGRRDPLSPVVSADGAVLSYDGDFNVSDLVLEGVMLNPKGKDIAIVNGRLFSTGDVIGDYKVETISQQRVVLLKGTERFELQLKKEE